MATNQTTASQTRILDAAEQIILRDGVNHLTIDAVAVQAGLSKGGVLYHFHSKDDLILGMIARYTGQYEKQMAQFESGDEHPEGRKLRSMLRASFPYEPGQKQCHMDRVCSALLAAVVNNSSLLGPVQEQARRFHADVVRQSRDPVLAMVLHMAADGIWMGGLFGVGLDPEMRDRVIERLLEMTKDV